MKNIDFAITMERDGADYYNHAAKTVKDPAAKNMLLSLAKDEEKHEQVLKNLLAGSPALFKAADFAGVKNAFKLLADTKAPFFKEKDSLEQILKKALQMENKSVQLYDFLADERHDPDDQYLFAQLADEERKHAQILQLTLENLNSPHAILENAEFLFDSDTID